MSLQIDVKDEINNASDRALAIIAMLELGFTGDAVKLSDVHTVNVLETVYKELLLIKTLNREV